MELDRFKTHAILKALDFDFDNSLSTRRTSSCHLGKSEQARAGIEKRNAFVKETMAKRADHRICGFGRGEPPTPTRCADHCISGFGRGEPPTPTKEYIHINTLHTGAACSFEISPMGALD